MTAHWSDEQMNAAVARGNDKFEREPRATAARFEPASGRVLVELNNGCTFAFPARRVQGLEDASDAEIAEVEVLGVGFALHWETRDVDVSLGGLMNGVFGTQAWMHELARRGGSVSTPAKAAAARANGAKGGRPRKAG